MQVDGNDHLPRRLYRNYLHDVRRNAIDRCCAAGMSVHLDHAEVVRARRSSDDELLLTTDRGLTYPTTVMILCTGHNAPQDHYGLASAENYLRDPYTRFTFPDREDIEVGILGSGLSAVDAATELASTHRTVKITCFSRTGLFPTVQPITSPEISNDFRDALDFGPRRVRIGERDVVGHRPVEQEVLLEDHAQLGAVVRQADGVQIAPVHQDPSRLGT